MLPESVREIGEQAFEGCPISDLSIPKGVTAIAEKAFFKCFQLQELNLPEGLTDIGRQAFSGCSSLKNLALPASLTFIDGRAFSGCSGLNEVVIPDSVTEIGGGAFCGIAENAQIVAPHIPFSAFQHADDKRCATLGFLSHFDRYKNNSGLEDYKKYANAQKKKLLPEIFRQDFPQALAFYGEEGKITAANFETEYMIPAEKANATGCIAYLLDWRNKTISASDVEKEIERKLMKDPYNITDMKKLWTYESMEDGTLMITSYKGTETDITIPERIGKKPVTRLDDCAFSIETKEGTKRA